jgi:dihydroorotate dehydrogenase
VSPRTSRVYGLARRALFRLDPEQAHARSLEALAVAGATGLGRSALRAVFFAEGRPVHAFGLTFPNVLGVAAGYDKDARAVHGLAAIGFGHVEVGTVTPAPQPGNPSPRLFRLPEDRAVINRLGFPSAGADVVLRRLERARPCPAIIGVNIGKQRETPIEEAARDYTGLMRTLAPVADYLAINVSSPNTVGLRRLQAREALLELLQAVAAERASLAEQGRRVPVLVKIAPDLTDDELDDALAAILATGMDGVIATNTTLARDGLSSASAREAGGLSGAPLRDRSTAVVAAIATRTGGRLPIIGVGGVSSPDDAREKLDAGATLVQLYTGLIYEGPGLAAKIVRSLS